MGSIKDIRTIVIGCFILAFLLMSHYCFKPNQTIISLLHKLGLNFILCFSVWGGSILIGTSAEKLFPLTKHPKKRIIYQFTLSAIYAVLAVNILVSVFFKNGYVDGKFNIEFDWTGTLLAIFITFFLIAADLGKEFFKLWKGALVESEKLKKETVQSQFEALKTQINPHFLFNSLNTLAAIIPEDTEKSVEFVEKLSKVYRYLMQYRDFDTVDLETELNCVEAYFFLQQTRFGENLKIEIEVTDTYRNLHLPPLTLQMLAENAIKHNVVSAAKPLTVKIYVEEEHLLVVNNLQKKTVIESSTKVGILNIKNRYNYIAEKEINVTETSTDFIVKLPLLSIK